MQGRGYSFKTALFEIEPGEDEITNPRRYGRVLAHWLASRLAQRGYAEATALPEDWGWCVECQSGPVRTWVGCGNMEDVDARPDDAVPAGEDLTWHCFPAVDVPLLARILGRAGEFEGQLRRLDADLHQILANEDGITLVDATDE